MTVSILGKKYDVKEEQWIDTAGLLGQASRDKLTIFLRKDLPRDLRDETLLHEIIHVISDELTLGLDEDEVSRLSIGIYSAGYRL